jgi:CIC family chloride channel protein
MGAVSASIVGAPITMVLLVLEMTGNFPATTAVLIGVLFSSTITRYFFGYSFSTWRFHLRGLRITGAYDIGWVNELTMESLMQKDIKTMPVSMTLAQLRKEISPTSVRRVFAVDEHGHYKGVVDVAAAHSADLDSKTETMTVGELVKGTDFFLLPRQNIQQALELFSSSEQEELPIVNSIESRMIIGRVSEAHMLRRYAHELETRNMAQSGAAAPVET